MSQKILVAEDEADMLHLVATNLTAAGYSVLKAENGPLALELARTKKPALLVLDLMLPGMSGQEVCRVLKNDPATARTPIIMLTAKAGEKDRITGLELGADDYVTKPFSPRELILRVKSVLRRAGESVSGEPLVVGPLQVDFAKHEVRVKNKLLDLTATEFRLVSLLLERRGRVQSRDKLLNDVWGYEAAIDSRTVDTHVRRLREKLGAAADYIETVRGFGYRFIN